MKLNSLFALIIISGCLAIAQTKPACKPTPTPTPTPATGTITNNNTNTNANTNLNSATSTANSSSISTSSASQQQRQTQSQSATGGTANASGGTANASGGGNGSNNTSNSTKVAASAIAPPFLPTVPCFKGAGAAVQVGMIGGSLGGGKVDQGCDDRELARSFSGPQTPASCKILINTKKAKKAGVTMAECLNIQYPEPPSPVAELIPTPVISVTPQVLVIPITTAIPLLAPPEYRVEMTVHIPKEGTVRKLVHHLPPNCQNVVIMKCATKEK